MDHEIMGELDGKGLAREFLKTKTILCISQYDRWGYEFSQLLKR